MAVLLAKTDRGATGLEEGHRKAESASEAKSRLLAAMSRELRTPLDAITGFAERLLMHDLEQMAAAQRRGDITDVLDDSQLEADHLPLSERVFDLGQFLHHGLRPAHAPTEAGTVRLHLSRLL